MSSTPQLSAHDVTLIAFAFQSLKDDHPLQIDYAKLAELAGYKTAASANACFLVVKKKLMGGASVSNAASGSTPKKAKGKATNPEREDDDEVTPTKAAPKKRGKTIKTEPIDAEGGDADTEATPTAESPKKGRAKKGTGPSSTDVNGDTPTPKRKRGPTKPKDPNATPTKRAKKGANAGTTTGMNKAAADNNDTANTHINEDETAAQTNGGGSVFGGYDTVKKEEEEEQVDNSFDMEEQEMVDDALFNTYTTEGEVA